MTATLFEVAPAEEKFAHLSPDGVYRYRLHRVWGPGKRVTFVMLNPSTADHQLDDPTIVRCRNFAKGWGYDGLNVVNLYAFRATQPSDMLAAADPVGPDNDGHLAAAAMFAAMHEEPIVGAWGANAGLDRVAEVMAIPHMNRLQCLAITKDGQPRHPLYMRGDSHLTPWVRR